MNDVFFNLRVHEWASQHPEIYNQIYSQVKIQIKDINVIHTLAEAPANCYMHRSFVGGSVHLVDVNQQMLLNVFDLFFLITNTLGSM